MTNCALTPILLLVTTFALRTAAAEPESARQILDATGVRGGLIVHLGCGDGQLTTSLHAADNYLVHGLARDVEHVVKAREHIRSQGLCGQVCVERFQGTRLPYADNLANLVVAEQLDAVLMSEVMRVLAPNGVAYVKRDGKWTTTTKPWPDEIDEWTHYLHDASGNAVADDAVVAAPSRLQWMDGPLWSRSHEYDASLCAMVSANGRLFYIFDEGPTGIVDPRIPDRWTLIARDAFNGVVLWKRSIPDWGWRAWKRAELEQAEWRRMPSQRNRLPLAVPRRLVAAGNRIYVTLGYHAPVTALDAATGKTVMTYADTQRTDEIVHAAGTLVLCIRPTAAKSELPVRKGGRPNQQAGPGTLVALQADSGQRLWQTKPNTVVPLSLAVSGPNAFFHDAEAVVCLDSASGQQRWRTPAGRAGNSIWNTDTTLVVYEKVVLCANRGQFRALSVVDGTTLWTLPGAKGFSVVNPPDLFVADGLVWYGHGGPEPQSVTGYDPLTGKPARTVDVGPLITHGHHARCYRSKATENYLLLPKRAVEFIDIKRGNHSRHNWVRGGCRYGLMPCNGLLYSTPHPCFCYAGVKLNGLLALAGQVAEAKLSTSKNLPATLERGPAFGKCGSRNAEVGTDGDASSASTIPHSALRIPHSNDWPMYRHDAQRSGSTSTAVGAHVRPAWQMPLGGKLTQPVIVGGRLFVARVDAGQVCCLDAASGRPIWDYITGGRIDSAPTHYKGHLIFGSADGWVYCLRVADGALSWRFRAAPAERCVVAFGRVESAWPVHGSVLIMNDVAYFAAGRSSLDGGIILYGLDPLSGAKRYETTLDGPHPDTKQLDENAYAMEGSKSDVLVTDGEFIYLFHNAFNERLEKQPTPIQGEPGVRNLGVRGFGRHLFSNAGFLDDSWFNRNHWMYGDRWTAFNFTHQSPQAGQLVVFDEKCTYAVKCFVRRNMLSPLAFPATDGYFLVADNHETRPVLVSSDGKGGPDFRQWLPQEGKLQTCWNLGVGFARSQPAQWINVIPVRVRAMVRTADVLFAAGPPDVCDPDDPSGAFEERQGAVLAAFNPQDGKALGEHKLDQPPVFDGMAAAGGRLYLSLEDGSILCMQTDR